MSLQQNKNLKKPLPAPALRKHSACIAAAKNQSAVVAPFAAATTSTKHSARAALKDNDLISSKEEAQQQFRNHEDSSYTNKDAPPAAAKRPALDSNKIAVITPAKTNQSTMVFVKDLQDLAHNNNSRLKSKKLCTG